MILTTDRIEVETATIIAQRIEELNKSKSKEENRNIIIAFCGGRSIKIISEYLKIQSINWDHIHFFLIDDKDTDVTDTASNYHLIKEHLLDNIQIPKENIHPYEKVKGIDAYNKEFLSIGGIIDIALISSGEDGHSAGLYPNHESIKSEEKLFFTYSPCPKPPSDRMTASKGMIKNADTCIILFNGETKKEAFENFIDPEKTEIECPAKIALSCKNQFILKNFG